MTSKQWPRFVLPIVRKEWYEKMMAVPSPAMQFFGVESSTASVEYSQGIGAFDLVPEYNSADAEGNPASIAYDDFSSLHEKTFTHKEYAKGVAVERKLWDDDQRGLIRRRAQSLGFSFGTTRATHAASVFNNAFSASYVGADSVALCSDSHPVNEKTPATTYDNKGTTALSYDAVKTTLIAGHDLNDDRGNPMPSIYDVLYVPTALQGTAYEIVNAMAKPGSADNDANALDNMAPGLRVVVDPYLTDANNWFMIDSRQSTMHLLWFNRVMPGITMDPASDFNLVARYAGYMRYSFGWDNARFVYGHEVA
jgi:phage major head subunit gpT-like protein